MKTSNKINADHLRSILSYDPLTGIFRWILSPKNRVGKIKSGDEAGCLNTKKYRFIGIDGVRYYAHRLAWLYMTDSFPPHQIDHIDLNKSNNAWENLRLATASQNQAHRPISKRNKSGFKGVFWIKDRAKWRATTRENGKSRYIGHFDTPEDAHEAYCREAKRIFGEFSHSG